MPCLKTKYKKSLIRIKRSLMVMEPTIILCYIEHIKILKKIGFHEYIKLTKQNYCIHSNIVLQYFIQETYRTIILHYTI